MFSVKKFPSVRSGRFVEAPQSMDRSLRLPGTPQVRKIVLENLERSGW